MGHVNVTEWTDALFNDCFDKLKTLVRSLGLTADVEKNTLDQFADWQTKGTIKHAPTVNYSQKLFLNF